MTISFESSGRWEKTRRWLKRMSRREIFRNLDKHGQRGVSALASSTPKDSGETANSWGYEIRSSGRNYEIHWTNSNMNQGVNIAVIIQTGHGTGTGGYVQGRDYINPAIQPVFDEIAESVWKEVTE